MKFIDFDVKIDYPKEIFAGMAVAMTMIPESLSFAILAGLSPQVGLYAAFLMGLVTSVLGGRPGLVSGGAGATVVVIMALAASHGVQYLFAAVLLAGVIQFLVGLFRWGKFVRLIPQPVMYGFLNGLAIIIFMAQVAQFRVNGNGSSWMQGPALFWMIGLTLITIAVVRMMPRLTKKIPASLTAIVVVFALVKSTGLSTRTVGDIAAVSGGWPVFSWPQVPWTLDTFQIVLPYALLMASVGLIESLLTLSMVDEMTQTRGSTNRESMAQGVANFVNGIFGGMGGCAMVAQTIVNLEAGSRTRLSAFIASIVILLIILIGGPVIEQIPMAALVGVMMMAAVSTFQWNFLRVINRMPRMDIFVGILVAVITVASNNLAIAVLVGVIISALSFAWESAKRIRARRYIDDQGVKHYDIYGPLFFGSVAIFNEKFDIQNDPDEVIIDFRESRVVDMSAIEALNKLTRRYKEAGKTIRLTHLSPDCHRLIKNADKVIEVNVIEDPTYTVLSK